MWINFYFVKRFTFCHFFQSIQSVQSLSHVLTLCNSMDYSIPGFPVHHQLPELAQTHLHRVSDTISSSVVPFSSCLQSFPESGSFPRNQFFASGGQIVGPSASGSVLPMNIQGSFPLGLTSLISLQSKGLSGVLSNSSKASVLWSSANCMLNCHIHTWLLDKP